ncbi:gamma carbonic anhydrase family protein, partial [Empedobacter brevis]
MAIIKELNGHAPKFGDNCFLADNAVIVGEVEMGNDCSIWFSAVVRGDVHYIKMGNKVNIQDNATIHATYQKSPTTIGNNVSIGHNAIVHGCTIHDNVLIGMGAIVMDDCIVESNSLIAAGAILTKGSHV